MVTRVQTLKRRDIEFKWCCGGGLESIAFAPTSLYMSSSLTVVRWCWTGSESFSLNACIVSDFQKSGDERTLSPSWNRTSLPMALRTIPANITAVRATEASRAPASLKTRPGDRSTTPSWTSRLPTWPINYRPGYAPDWRYRGWFRAQPQSWRGSRRPYCSLRYCLVTWSPSEASARAARLAYGLVCDGTSHQPKFHSEN